MQQMRTSIPIDEVLRNIAKYYFYRPYDYVVEVIGAEPTTQQQKVLLSMQQGQRFISIRSGHGVGKTALASWIIQWFIATRPNSRVPCTAPTNKQLLDILWPELRKWQTRSIIGGAFEWANTRFGVTGKEKTWFAVARSSNKPNNLQGFHEGHIMFVIDEASGVPEEIMQVVQGALTTQDVWCLMLGNPTEVSGLHYRSFHEDRKNWSTFTFSSEESSLVSPDYCERMAASYGGRDSDIYRMRVLGLHPREAVDALFSTSEIRAAMHREIPDPSIMEITIGVDVARFGDDKTVLVARRGNKVWILEEFYKKDTMYTAGRALHWLNHFEQESIKVTACIDDAGVGGGVTDRLRQLARQGKHESAVIDVNFGEKAFNDNAYANRGTELWYRLKNHIIDLSLPDHEALLNDLIARKKRLNTKDKLILESKEEMKKRGIKSPDHADALVLTFATSERVAVLRPID